MTTRLPPSSQVERPRISTDASSIHPQHPTHSTEIHRGSQQRYKEMVRKIQTPRCECTLKKEAPRVMLRMQDSNRSCIQLKFNHLNSCEIKSLSSKQKILVSLSSSAPDQLYIMPVTDSMKYGWMLHEIPEPWTRIKRFPRKNSEMTKQVEHPYVMFI